MGRPQLNKKQAVIETLNGNQLKLVQDSTKYTIKPNVMDKYSVDFAKFGVKNGALVEVSYNDNNEVSYIKKVKKEDVKVEEKSESKPELTQEVKQEVENGESQVFEWTILGITPDHKVMGFKESSYMKDGQEKRIWYNLSEKVQKLVESGAVKAGEKSTRKVTIVGKEVVDIEAIQLQEEVKRPENKATDSDVESCKSEVKVKVSNTNDSICRQVAAKNATEIIKLLIEKDREEVNSSSKIVETLHLLTQEGIKDLVE